MADYLTNTTDLTKVANAIRTQTGKSSSLTYPDEFATEIGTLTDVSDTTAVASDVAQGKTFHLADGTQTIGTNSGGGGSDSFIVTLSWDDDYFGQDDGAWVPDCTINELQNAYTGGKTIAFIGENGESVQWFFDDDYVYIYYILVEGNRPNEIRNKGYLFNAQSIEYLEDTILIYPNFISPTRTYTPTESVQTETITYDTNDNNGIEQVRVTVNAIPSNYVGTGIDRRDSTDLTASGATVTAPAGYYASSASKSVASGTAGTPTATKGPVSNHAVTVTPSVTNTTGYITGSTKTGTAVSVSASELVSGSQTITSNQTVDVTNLAEVVVNVSGGGGSPKKFVMRPDAELVQTYSEDYLAVADKGKTLPSYSTSSQVVVASANLSPTISIDVANYDYFVTMRGLAIPQYNTKTKQKGRCDYTATSYAYELLVTPPNDAHTIDGTKSYSSRGAAVVANGSAFRELYWTSATAIGIGNSTPFGVYAMGTTPTISGSTLTIKSPACAIRGHTTYMTSGAWSTMKDIRYQWIIDVWKAPITKVAGWEHTSTIRSIFADVRNSGDLT